MKKIEEQIIIETIQHHQNVVQHYYELGKKTGEWKDHEIACSVLRAVRELADCLEIKLD